MFMRILYLQLYVLVQPCHWSEKVKICGQKFIYTWSTSDSSCYGKG